MQISVIDTIASFDQLKPNWDEVYASDGHTTIFVSWPWLRAWFEVIRDGNWIVLALRPHGASSYVAFFPLGINRSQTHLAMGGNDMACHTGFVCVPEYQDKAIASFAEFIQQQIKWEQFKLGNVSDPRLDSFLSHFSFDKFSIQELDHLVCPYLPLPETWDEYLEKCMGTRTREEFRSKMRKLERLDQFRITEVHANNLDEQINTFLALWQMRWESTPEAEFQWLLKWFRPNARFCLENDCLYLTILWSGKNPIAGLKAYVDRPHRTFSTAMLGWDDQYEKLSPGTVMQNYSIKYAIEEGLTTYDFLSGTEAYKYRFGAIDRSNRNVIIERKDLRIIVKKLLRQTRYYCSRIKSKVLN